MKATSLRVAALAALSTTVIALSGCEELPQDGPKPFAGPEETRSYASDRFRGDRAVDGWTLTERARTQDEYLVIPNGAK